MQIHDEERTPTDLMQDGEPVKTMDIAPLRRIDGAYPDCLAAYLGSRSPGTVYSLGDVGILKRKKLALFCSVKCPGNLILKTYDLARELRDAGVTVISGFHSPMEKECLSVLLRGKQPVIWCPAKRLMVKGVPKEYAGAIAEKRLLLLSPFDGKIKRATEETALFLNEFVAALADQVFVPYAAPGSKTESFCRQIIEWRKSLLTFDDPDNATLRGLGAQSFRSVVSIAAGKP